MTSSAHAGNRILGSLRSQDGKGVVTVRDRFDTDIDDLWSAITDPERLARWHGRLEGDLRPGGEFRLYGPRSGQRRANRGVRTAAAAGGDGQGDLAADIG